jgi:hypothetical protein
MFLQLLSLNIKRNFVMPQGKQLSNFKAIVRCLFFCIKRCPNYDLIRSRRWDNNCSSSNHNCSQSRLYRIGSIICFPLSLLLYGLWRICCNACNWSLFCLGFWKQNGAFGDIMEPLLYATHGLTPTRYTWEKAVPIEFFAKLYLH